MAEIKVALRVRDLTFSYADSDRKVLAGVSFDLEYGKLYLLSGDTGAGKSTLIKVLTRVIPEEIDGVIGGQILLDGVSIGGRSVGQMARKVGLLTQCPEFQIFHRRVDDELLFGMENFDIPYSQANERLQRALAEIHLRGDAQTGFLSGGEKSILVTESILLMERRILILDEPLANLDARNTILLLHRLKDLAKSGYAILIIEHRTALVEPFADVCLRLENGSTFVGQAPKPALDIVKSRTELGPTILEAEDLSLAFNGRRVLDQLALQVRAGEIIGILGENGSGKTTLLRVLSGQLKKNWAGHVRLQGKVGRPGSRRWFQHIGVVLQNPVYSLFESTVEKEMKVFSPDADYAMSVAASLHLDRLLSRHPQSLSEGEKRRLALAVELAKKPAILFLDEPTAGQDRESVNLIAQALERFAAAGGAIVIVTHDESLSGLLTSAYQLKGAKLHPISPAEYFKNELSLK
ncbi:MAG TPA: hypothetical protein DEA32_01125 [Firmicutes bacterium]|nr:hypothetical protein [Bacillota bacterium]